MEHRGLRSSENRKTWVEDISSRKVDFEDFEEVVEILNADLAT